MPRQAWSALSARTKKIYQKLQHRYGPRYTQVMLGTAFFTFFVPVPGTVLLALALVVAIAEVHRAISSKGGISKQRVTEGTPAVRERPITTTGEIDAYFNQ